LSLVLGSWLFRRVRFWERIPGSTGFGDYEVRAGYSWSYGLLPFDPDKSQRLVRPRSSPPFQVEWISRKPVAPVMIEVTGRLLNDWPIIAGVRRDRFPSQRTLLRPEEKLFLVPYGCTRIRIAEFPVLSG